MKKTIIELLIEWWVKTTTHRLPLPVVYTYEVEVDGEITIIASMRKSRMYVLNQARNNFPNAKCIRVVKQIRQY